MIRHNLGHSNVQPLSNNTFFSEFFHQCHRQKIISNILSIIFSNEDLCHHQKHIPYFCLNHGDYVQFVQKYSYENHDKEWSWKFKWASNVWKFKQSLNVQQQTSENSKRAVNVQQQMSENSNGRQMSSVKCLKIKTGVKYPATNVCKLKRALNIQQQMSENSNGH